MIAQFLLLNSFSWLIVSLKLAAIENIPFVQCSKSSSGIEYDLIKLSIEEFSPGSTIECLKSGNLTDLLNTYDFVFGGMHRHHEFESMKAVPYSFLKIANSKIIELFSGVLSNDFLLLFGCPIIAAFLVYMVEPNTNYHVIWRAFLHCFFIKPVNFHGFYSKLLLGLTKILVFIIILNILSTNCADFIDFLDDQKENYTQESIFHLFKMNNDYHIIWESKSNMYRFRDIYPLVYYTNLIFKNPELKTFHKIIQKKFYSTEFQNSQIPYYFDSKQNSKRLNLEDFSIFYFVLLGILLFSIFFFIIEKRRYFNLKTDVEFKDNSNKEVLERFRKLWGDYSKALKSSINRYSQNRKTALFFEDPNKVDRLSVITLRRLKNNRNIRKFYNSKTSSMRRISSILDYKKKGRKSKWNKNAKSAKNSFKEEFMKSKPLEKVHNISPKKKISLYSYILNNVQKDKSKKIKQKSNNKSKLWSFFFVLKKWKIKFKAKNVAKNEIELTRTFLDVNSTDIKLLPSPSKGEIKSPTKRLIRNIWKEDFVQSEPEKPMPDLEISPLNNEDSLFKNSLKLEMDNIKSHSFFSEDKSFEDHKEGPQMKGNDQIMENSNLSDDENQNSDSDGEIMKRKISQIQEVEADGEEEEEEFLLMSVEFSKNSLEDKIESHLKFPFGSKVLKKSRSYSPQGN